MGINVDQKIYDMAEWLVHNYESVKAMLMKDLLRWKEAKKDLADTPAIKMKYNTEINKKYRDAIMRMVADHHKKFDAWDIQIAFEDERINIILDKYYMGDIDAN